MHLLGEQHALAQQADALLRQWLSTVAYSTSYLLVGFGVLNGVRCIRARQKKRELQSLFVNRPNVANSALEDVDVAAARQSASRRLAGRRNAAAARQ